MDRFDERKTKLIMKLVSEEEYVTGKILSIELNCSTRTIQGEVHMINQQVPGLILSTNKGYALDEEVMKQLNISVISPSKNDEHSILGKLIFDSPWQVDELADYLYISTTTLEKRLKAVKKTLSRYQLTLIRERASLSIDGKESDKRKLIKDLILDESNHNFNSFEDIAQYFPEIDIERVHSIVVNSIHKFDYFVENIYLGNLIINIVIALYRMHSDHYISQTYMDNMEKESVEYRIAKEICEQYVNQWEISPSELDISYIATVLGGQIKPLTTMQNDRSSTVTITQAFQREIESILTQVFDFYMLEIDFSGILYGFALHIDGMLKRVLHFPAEDNDILRNLKRSCPFIYDVSVFIAGILSKKYDVAIPDSEIGYISIHIGFLIEQAVENTEKVYVVLFGNDYHQIGNALEKKLMDSFYDLIELQVFENADSEILVNSSYDLILTLHPISVVGKKVLVISPFYTMLDQTNINRAIQNCLKEKKRLFIKRLTSAYFDERLFFKRDDFCSKEEIIRFLSDRIIELGICEPSFYDSVMEREALSSTCFFGSFAIPHATTMDASCTMNCVLISEKGIPWDEYKIHLVMMIAVSKEDRKEFMKIYDGLVESLDKPETVKRLSTCRNFGEFMKTLSL